MVEIMEGKMGQLRIRIILLVCWLVLVFSAEQLFLQIDFSGTAYILILSLVFVILIVPRLLVIPVWVMVTVPILLLLFIKIWMGEFSSSSAIAFSIVEYLAIIATVLIAVWTSSSIRESDCAVANITVSRGRIPESESAGLGYIYREVRRARNHQRPLALLAIAVDKKSLKPSNGRMVKESQLATKLLDLSTILCDELEDCSVIVQGKDHFLVALPETNPEEVPIIIERLRRQVTEKIGIKLVIGIAFFPKDGFTFEGLVEKATDEMKANLSLKPFVDSQQRSVEKPIVVQEP